MGGQLGNNFGRTPPTLP